jgi:hypothetical protein
MASDLRPAISGSLLFFPFSYGKRRHKCRAKNRAKAALNADFSPNSRQHYSALPWITGNRAGAVFEEALIKADFLTRARGFHGLSRNGCASAGENSGGSEGPLSADPFDSAGLISVFLGPAFLLTHFVGIIDRTKESGEGCAASGN